MLRQPLGHDTAVPKKMRYFRILCEELAEREGFELVVWPTARGSFPRFGFEALPVILSDILAQCSAGTLLNKSYPRNQTRRPVKDLAAFYFIAIARRLVSSWTVEWRKANVKCLCLTYSGYVWPNLIMT